MVLHDTNIFSLKIIFRKYTFIKLSGLGMDRVGEIKFF